MPTLASTLALALNLEMMSEKQFVKELPLRSAVQELPLGGHVFSSQLHF